MEATWIPALDPQVIASLCQDIRHDALRDVIEVFLVESDASLHDLERAIVAGDLRQIESLARNIKATARLLGASGLARASADLERAASGGVASPDLHGVLRQRWEQAASAFRSMLSDHETALHRTA